MSVEVPADDLSALPPELQITMLRMEVRQLSKDVKDLVDAWNAAGKMIKFVKLVASIVTAAGIVWGAIKLAWQH